MDKLTERYAKTTDPQPIKQKTLYGLLEILYERLNYLDEVRYISYRTLDKLQRGGNEAGEIEKEAGNKERDGGELTLIDELYSISNNIHSKITSIEYNLNNIIGFIG